MFTNRKSKFNFKNYLQILLVFVGNFLFSQEISFKKISRDTLLTNKKNNHKFFQYWEGGIGLNINQCSLGYNYYEINYKPTFSAGLNLYSFKNLNLNFAANYIKKSLVGNETNAHKNYYIFRYKVRPIYNPNIPKYNLDLVYLSFDLKARIIFFKKKKLQPFISLGIRNNVLLKYQNNDSLITTTIDGFVIPNLKKYQINSLYGLGISYFFKRFNTVSFAEIEVNDDTNYFTKWKYGVSRGLPIDFERFLGGKFNSMIFRIGLRLDIKLKRNERYKKRQPIFN